MIQIIKSLLIGLLWIWQLPQNIAGSLLYLVCRLMRLHVESCGNRVYTVFPFCSGGVSLGEFAFIHAKSSDHADQCGRQHELGHRIQSRILGPLYLIIVGIPSVCINIAARYSAHIDATYYERFPENWADRLGGVKNGSND